MKKNCASCKWNNTKEHRFTKFYCELWECSMTYHKGERCNYFKPKILNVEIEGRDRRSGR
jgi:hypothetical protein